MKNAVFTSSDANYGDFLIENWLASLKASADLSTIEIIILDYGFSEEQRKRLALEPVTVVPCTRDGHVVSIRFRDMAAYLKNHSFGQVLSTDGGDLIFQGDLKELFESDKNDFRAVCEDMHLPFDAVFIDPFFSKEFAKKIKETIRGKKMVNAGVLAAPYGKFLALCEECDREILDKTKFGPDQMCINYILYRDGFLELEQKYNFVVATCQTPFSIQKSVFFMANGERIVMVHNAGGHPWFRPIKNFGFGAGKNRLKTIRYLAMRGFTQTVHFLGGFKK